VPRDGIATNDNKILEAVVTVLRIARSTAWPERSSLKANHIYTQHQHLALLVLRQLMGKSYREFCVWLDLLEPVRLVLNLDSCPHFTTLQKFAARIAPAMLERLIADMALGFALAKPIVAIDSTGMQPTTASYYFIETISMRKDELGMMKKRAKKRHTKMTVLMDIDSQLVVAVRCTQGPDSDFKHFIPTLDKARALGFRPNTILADKGYDSEANRKFARYRLQAETQIPVRTIQKNAKSQHGVLRRRQVKIFDPFLYRFRCLVETVHSVIKRTMGGFIRARVAANQLVELLIRVIAYNSKRTVTLQVPRS
jgi:transposase